MENSDSTPMFSCFHIRVDYSVHRCNVYASCYGNKNHDFGMFLLSFQPKFEISTKTAHE